MKSFATALVAIALSSVAQADLIKPATLDLICTETNSGMPRHFTVVSNSEGSTVVFGGRAYSGDQLSAGTEGGDAYLQAVNNRGGYNITIEGGDLVVAFDTNMTIKNGESDAFVQTFGNGSQDSFSAVCKGTFSFQ